jgi:hypothetical protein
VSFRTRRALQVVTDRPRHHDRQRIRLRRIDALCADIWEIEDGKIKKFGCYAEGTIIFAQLGILANLQAAFAPASV